MMSRFYENAVPSVDANPFPRPFAISRWRKYLTMPTTSSSCSRHFGHADFDPARLVKSRPTHCPVRGCSATLVEQPFGKQQDRERNPKPRTKPWCPEHGIRLHSRTFVYANGPGQHADPRLRNFIVKQDLVAEIALKPGAKAESHRLGYEMSEDALSWNVFASLAVAGRLKDAAQFLTDRPLSAEPSLYLWGKRIDVTGGERGTYPPLQRVRAEWERRIYRFGTEPDIMLVADGEMVICIEAKFGCGNTLAYESLAEIGEKPTSRAGLLARYLDRALKPRTKEAVLMQYIGEPFHSQIFRNIIFASEMAETKWHVVNLVSKKQSSGRSNSRYSYGDPEFAVRSYLHPDSQHSFTYRTWEGLHAAVIRDDAALTGLDRYMRGKSAHYLPAFELS